MFKGFIKNVLIAGAAVIFFAAVALAEKAKTIDVYTDAVLPDGQVLKAGKYQVLVGPGEKEVEFAQSGKVVAKHSCECLGHKEVSRYNQARYVETPDKKQRLTEIRFAGRSCILNLDVKQGM